MVEFPKSKSVIICGKCGENVICYHDKLHTLAMTDMDSCKIFKKMINKCSRCLHEKGYHYRDISEQTRGCLFKQSLGCNFDNISPIIDQLGGSEIINLLKSPLEINKTEHYLWMAVLWKNKYTTPHKKLQFIRNLEKKYKPNFNCSNNKGCTIIHNLCLSTTIVDTESSYLLLNYFVNDCESINDDIFKSLCDQGKTPLHYAAYFGRLDCVKILIQFYNKKDIHSLKDRSGKTIIKIAQIQHNLDVVQYLMDYSNYKNSTDDDDDEEKKKSDEDIYHEKQAWEMCLLHALNGLLQKQEFTHKSLDNICKQLSPNKVINPHKSIFQTGNYDANVLMMALSNVGIDVQWFDARKMNELNLNNNTFLEPDETFKFVGFILNNPQKAMFKLFSRRHWLAIKKLNNDEWYNLDSKLKQPKKFDDVDTLTAFLVNALTTNNAELMICREKIDKKTKNNEKNHNKQNDKKQIKYNV